MAELKLSFPPVPALAKHVQFNRQQLHALNHTDNPYPAGYNKPMLPELDSESQFTYLPEEEGRLAQAANHERHDLQQMQPTYHVDSS